MAKPKELSAVDVQMLSDALSTHLNVLDRASRDMKKPEQVRLMYDREAGLFRSLKARIILAE